MSEITTEKEITVAEGLGNATPSQVLAGTTFSSEDGFNLVGEYVPTGTTASDISYDNSLSGLTAQNMQAAIDEHVTNKNNPHNVTKSHVGLGNVDNTADADKPVSTEQRNAIDEVQSNLNTHTSATDNPHNVTAEQVGLGNVPNVSTNDQTPTFTPASTLETLSPGEKISALFGKIAKAIIDLISHIGNKSNPHGVTKDQIGLGNVDNTADNSKPVSTSQQDAIDAAYYNANQYTDQKISELINGAPSTLDTLKEIADAMAESEDVVEALNAAIGTKASQSELDSHLASKSNPHGVTKSQVGLGSVPNVTTNDQTPTYTEATTLASLNSGEKLSVAFGKIAKAVNDFINHLSASNPHNITSVSGNAGTATKLATARNIDGVSFDGSADIVHYAICETAADVAAKVVDIPNFVLQKGATIKVRFKNGNTAASPTLTVNGYGPKSIYYIFVNEDGTVGIDSYVKNSCPIIKDRIYEFVYDGSSKYYQWFMVNTLNSENHITSFSSSDSESPTGWTDVDVLKSAETHRSMFSKISTMFSNIRYIWNLIGTTDISAIGGGTVTDILSKVKLKVLPVYYPVVIQSKASMSVEFMDIGLLSNQVVSLIPFTDCYGTTMNVTMWEDSAGFECQILDGYVQIEQGTAFGVYVVYCELGTTLLNGVPMP